MLLYFHFISKKNGNRHTNTHEQTMHSYINRHMHVHTCIHAFISVSIDIFRLDNVTCTIETPCTWNAF